MSTARHDALITALMLIDAEAWRERQSLRLYEEWCEGIRESPLHETCVLLRARITRCETAAAELREMLHATPQGSPETSPVPKIGGPDGRS